MERSFAWTAPSAWLPGSVDFSFYALRFQFRAVSPICFPSGTAANTLRGAFGLTLRRLFPEPVYHNVFAPSAPEGSGPSGLHDRPRPFVLRAAKLDGLTVPSGDRFELGLNVFDVHSPRTEIFVEGFSEMARAGFGPGRGTAELELVEGAGRPVVISLEAPSEEPLRGIVVEFVTPTELKTVALSGNPIEFRILFARIRDRLSTLRALYGDGPLDIHFKAMGERAAAIRLVASELRHSAVTRRSSRTGQVHAIGGFTGWAHYQGDLNEFVPYLRAASFAGVGRQCVWGKGELRLNTALQTSI